MQRFRPVATIYASLVWHQRRQEWTVSRWTEGLEPPTSAVAVDGPGRTRRPVVASIHETGGSLYRVHNQNPMLQAIPQESPPRLLRRHPVCLLLCGVSTSLAERFLMPAEWWRLDPGAEPTSAVVALKGGASGCHGPPQIAGFRQRRCRSSTL
ncbi:hypothetical protein P168DRAFT_319953 [Aspergillus campestris IBT 28561]|uniref:Uncharacterized protein n=1 Tax=Aspergillus campestris (strain IBT 28561) TaxID=1392248 RepID=A0A2I1D0M1_ASPC2|nr:uncharacterized protein P168DRAFT_319953 [Aspergillus campestris IBT 28561]PKY03425.1 hypothetical protein P168DRAFT_319953 [Aspergillus campestris IBT 28561]